MNLDVLKSDSLLRPNYFTPKTNRTLLKYQILTIKLDVVTNESEDELRKPLQTS
jgi:hypothetical protein